MMPMAAHGGRVSAHTFTQTITNGVDEFLERLALGSRRFTYTSAPAPELVGSDLFLNTVAYDLFADGAWIEFAAGKEIANHETSIMAPFDIFGTAKDGWG